MFVCMCRAVTESHIKACIKAGANTIEELSERSLAGTGCGGCLDNVEMILEDGGVFALAEPMDPCYLPRSA
jgi:bacterioferritin-associated ferredoxin